MHFAVRARARSKCVLAARRPAAQAAKRQNRCLGPLTSSTIIGMRLRRETYLWHCKRARITCARVECPVCGSRCRLTAAAKSCRRGRSSARGTRPKRPRGTTLRGWAASIEFVCCQVCRRALAAEDLPPIPLLPAGIASSRRPCPSLLCRADQRPAPPSPEALLPARIVSCRPCPSRLCREALRAPRLCPFCSGSPRPFCLGLALFPLGRALGLSLSAGFCG